RKKRSRFRSISTLSVRRPLNMDMFPFSRVRLSDRLIIHPYNRWRLKTFANETAKAFIYLHDFVKKGFFKWLNNYHIGSRNKRIYPHTKLLLKQRIVRSLF